MEACIKMYFKIMLYNNLFLQAPKELREFIADHKFGQRNHSNGDPQEVDFTHQVGCPLLSNIKRKQVEVNVQF